MNKDLLQRMVGGVLERPALFFALWALWLSAEYWCFGYSSYLPLHDSADHYIPIITWITGSVRRLAGSKIIPVLSGMDRYNGANWLNGLSAFFFFLPPWLAHGVVMFIQRFVAGYFGYRFLRDGLRVRRHEALVGGLAYTLVNVELGEIRFMHGLDEPGFPFLLWFFLVVPLRPLFRALLPAIGVGLVLALSMGPFIAVPFLMPTAVLVSLILRDDGSTARRWWTMAGIAAVVGVVALAPHTREITALALNSADGHRAAWTKAFTPDALVNRLTVQRVPFLLNWWVGVCLALIWVVMGRLRTCADRAVLCLLLVGFGLGPVLGYLSGRFEGVLGILRGFTVTRFDKVAYFALLAAAVRGLHALGRVRWSASVGGGIARFSASSVLGALLLGAALDESVLMKESRWAAIRQDGKCWRILFQNPDIEALSSRVRNQPVRCATVGAHHLFHPMYLLAYDLETIDGYVDMYPERYQMFWKEVIRPLRQRDPPISGFFDWGCRVYLFHPSLAQDIAGLSSRFAESYNLDLLSLGNVRYLISKNPIDDARLQLLAPVVGDDVRSEWSAASLPQKFRRCLRGEQPPGMHLYVYENSGALDRFFVAERARLFDNEAGLYSALSSATLQDLRQTAFLLRGDVHGQALESVGGTGRVRLMSYSPDRAELRVDAEGRVLLIASNLYYPWWRCRIDGREAAIVPAYGAYQAVVVESGSHTVVFNYAPPYASNR